MNIIVTGNTLEFADKKYMCAVGKNGFVANKKEGDLCTPIGTFPLRKVYYRADKLGSVATALPTQITQPDDGWCDAPNNQQYNKPVKLPFAASHEKMWRDDDLYDAVLVLGHNDSPPVAGAGSAIFMHVAKPNYEGTEGCIALKKDDLLELLAAIAPDTQIELRP